MTDPIPTLTPPAPEFAAITTQADLDRILGERLSRERGKFADYEALKAKAGQFDALEQANKTEAQKASDAQHKAEAERDAARAEALRFRVAAKHGISDEDAALFLTGSDEATLGKQAARLGGLADDRKKQGNHVAREGANHTASSGDERAFVRQLFGSGG